MISSIQNFPIIPTLENLSLNNNSIKDSMQFVMSVSDKYPKLISINTLRNPMNPGFDQPEAYKRYKNTLKAITTLRMVDGMDINDQQTVDQIKYNNDMAKSTGGQKTMKTSMANFFSSKTTSKNPLESTAQKGSTQPAQAQQTQPKASMMSFFNASTIVSNDPPKVEVVQPKRIMYSIDESEEIDGTAYVKANKGRATIYFSEKQLKKSDNLTKFNRKNHSEGNKHILNAHL